MIEAVALAKRASRNIERVGREEGGSGSERAEAVSCDHDGGRHRGRAEAAHILEGGALTGFVDAPLTPREDTCNDETVALLMQCDEIDACCDAAMFGAGSASPGIDPSPERTPREASLGRALKAGAAVSSSSLGYAREGLVLSEVPRLRTLEAAAAVAASSLGYAREGGGV
uniref:Uncharacterized protein n=1 Tax=Calcidiscus leptoporus TaxID=127549 RepID=A0A6U5H4H8_9EUKA|mmetsp:Transcript_32644/g.76120  ORF Transcript_32644/g.76120 Transcript_32644/m.76120 type:complete len:171 (+) Transcript_32644:156-668(+)